jgi:hypothetical protein
MAHSSNLAPFHLSRQLEFIPLVTNEYFCTRKLCRFLARPIILKFSEMLHLYQLSIVQKKSDLELQKSGFYVFYAVHTFPKFF